MEFITFVSILIVILLLTIYYNSSYYIQLNNVKFYNDAQSVSENIASEINLALKAGDGYSRIFNTPFRISDSFDYNVSVSNYLVLVNWTRGRTQSVILIKNITGSINKGQNLIKNIDGIIYVN